MATKQTIIAAAAAIGACSAAGSAAIIPSWRVNPISPEAIAEAPELGNALSISLMVTLTGGSLFNIAGLDLTGLLPGVEFYNHPAGPTVTRPKPTFIPIFPAIEFDTYVCRSDPETNTSAGAFVPGRLNGTGTALVGDGGVNVAWGASPNSGPLGGSNLEIARITSLQLVSDRNCSRFHAGASVTV